LPSDKKRDILAIMKMRGQLNIFLFVLILLLPAYSEAAYKIYLKNGSVIEGVGKYEKRDGEVILYFGGGTFGISEREFLKIEETEAPEKDFRAKELPEKEEVREIPHKAPAVAEKRARVIALKADLEVINSELKAAEENEARIKASIDELKRIPRPRLGPHYVPDLSHVIPFPPPEVIPEPKGPYQLRREWRESGQLIIEKEQELSKIQNKKAELLQQRGLMEEELRSLE